MEKFIKKWAQIGYINSETAEILLNDVKEEKDKLRRKQFNILIYTVAAIFIGLGIITFIGANEWLIELFNKSPILRIFALAAFTIISLLGGYKLAFEIRKFPRLGHSLIFLSTLLIGGTYAVIGQNYNINANNSSLMFLWLVSILPVAYIFRSFAINAISIILFILGVVFYYMEIHLDYGLTWTVFIPVIIGVGLYTAGNIPVILRNYNKFSLSYKLTGLVPIFVTLLVLTCSVEGSYQLTSMYYYLPLVCLVFANLGIYFINKNSDNLLKIETLFMNTFLIMLLMLISLPVISPIFVTILANIAIIIIIFTGFNYGYKYENGNIIGITNNFLIVYLTTNYFRWGWSYMDKALFFIFGGLSLLALGMFLENKRKQVIKKEK